jgi:hypothetical protein
MNNYLSASRIKKLEECSWQYYCRYVLKLPDESNDGAKMGSICHNVFEYLGKDRHKKHFDSIIKVQNIEGSKAVNKYVNICASKEGVDSQQHLTLLNKMILQGLSYDFYGNKFGKPIKSFSEIDFQIEVDKDDKKYRILGFIDKLFLYKDGAVLIRDFKSSKKKFEGKEIDDNVQDLMYRLAVKNMFPEYYDAKMEFVFLQYPCENGDGVINTPHVCDTELSGFEHYLTDLQRTVDNFDEKLAERNMAYDKGYLHSSAGFSGRLVCGRSDHPEEKKVDGSNKWFCRMKFPFFYWALLDKNGAILNTSKEKKDLAKPKKGEKIEKRFYKGCPKFKFLEYSQEMNAKAKKEGL